MAIKITSILILTFVVALMVLNFGSITLWLSANISFLSQAPEPVNALQYQFPISDLRPAETPNPSESQTNKRSSVSSQSSFYLQIPTLGISAPIVLEPSVDQNKIYKSLESGLVHYADTPLPGDYGTSIILGHSSSYPWYKGDYGSIFAPISTLKTGDIINVIKDGKTLSYEVKKSLVFSPATSDDYQLNDLEYTHGSSLIIMTCWPVGTNAKRVAVRADLII